MTKTKKLATSIAVVCTILASTVYAASVKWRTDTFYYANSSYTGVVGMSFQDCDGSIYSEGKVTPYKKTRIDSYCGPFNNF